jgi:hypothetical protein
MDPALPRAGALARRAILPAVTLSRTAVEPSLRRCGYAVRVLALALLALACVPGCRGKNEFKPTKLMPPLYSGYSLQKVQRELNLKPGGWEVLEDRRPLTSDKRPPFRILTISSQGFTKFGATGELVMTFYNDRLMTSLLYPTDLEALHIALAREAGISFTRQGDARIEPTTRVWIGKARDGRSYIGWIDMELEREREDWIEKHER